MGKTEKEGKTMRKIRLLTLLLAVMLLWGCGPKPQLPGPATKPTTTETTGETTEATQETTEATQPEPQPVTYTISFAGDCTLGTDELLYGQSFTFVALVGDHYEYPFQSVRSYFAEDDFTFVNLEGTFTKHRTPMEKKFRFRGPVEYAKILTAGDIEVVNLANNHSYDYGVGGYESTLDALEKEGIVYVEEEHTVLYTTESGLKVGLYADQFGMDVGKMKSAVAKLRQDGAEIVIVSYHGGTEGSYKLTSTQKNYAHAVIDAGADIFFGHHPHVLQAIENYNGGVIYYSLGNFSFGGNRNPGDKDTAILQQEIVREADGTVRLGETKIVPCCLSSTTKKNTYQPTPYEEGSAAYDRVLQKLAGTYKSSGSSSTTEKPKETTPAETTQPTTQTTTEATTQVTTEAATQETTEATTEATTQDPDQT